MGKCYIGKRVCWVETEYASMRWDFDKSSNKWICDIGDDEIEWDIETIKHVIENEMNH